MPTTRALLDRLACDQKLRRICGWEQKGEIPSEATFSRAFAEFSETQLPACVHQALTGNNLSEKILGHILRDSTEIDVRGKPQKKAKAEVELNQEKPKRKVESSEERGGAGETANAAGAAKNHDIKGDVGRSAERL